MEPGQLGSQLLCLLPHGFLGALAFRAISGNLWGTHDLAAGIPYRRDRRRDVDPLTIFSHSNGFEGVKAFAARNAPQDVDFLVRAVRGEQHGGRTSDRLRLRVAENFLGAVIPTRDRSVRGYADDGVFGR